MIFSARQIFSDDQLITADAISENVIDLGVAGTPYGAASPLGQDVGKGNMVPVLVQVTADFNTLTSLEVTIETSANADLSSSTVLATEVIPLADLVAGKQMFCQVIPNGANARYLGVRYNVTGTNPTQGAIAAGITMGNQTNITGV
jgi:hypothetical protein